MKITNEGPIGNHFKKENIFLGTITSSNDDVFEELKGRVNSEVPLDFLRGMIDAGVISGQQYDLFYLDENGYIRFLEEGPETFKGDNSDGKGTIDNVVPAWDYFGEDDLTEVLVNDKFYMISCSSIEPLERYNQDYNLNNRQAGL